MLEKGWRKEPFSEWTLIISLLNLHNIFGENEIEEKTNFLVLSNKFTVVGGCPPQTNVFFYVFSSFFKKNPCVKFTYAFLTSFILYHKKEKITGKNVVENWSLGTAATANFREIFCYPDLQKVSKKMGRKTSSK